MPSHQGNILTRISRLTVTRGTCRLWAGAVQRRNGKTPHGKIYIGSQRDGTVRNAFVHRVVYEVVKGPILPGFQINHRCGNSLCVNPTHLYVGTQRDNMHDLALKKTLDRSGGGW